jgi:hypothetical protein
VVDLDARHQRANQLPLAMPIKAVEPGADLLGEA